jgi:hypothetical protein
MIDSFKVFNRDPDVGHWDIWNSRERIFKIRGAPGDYVVIDERNIKSPSIKFNSVAECMAFICRELMS